MKIVYLYPFRVISFLFLTYLCTYNFFLNIEIRRTICCVDGWGVCSIFSDLLLVSVLGFTVITRLILSEK